MLSVHEIADPCLSWVKLHRVCKQCVNMLYDTAATSLIHGNAGKPQCRLVGFVDYGLRGHLRGSQPCLRTNSLLHSVAQWNACHWKELPGAPPLCSAPKDIMSNADAASASFPNAVVGLLQTGNCTPSLP